jgi:pimeloyl-ACP methyl ester carboxylesterase
MRNHGESFRADSQSYPEMAGDLAEVIAGAGGVADVIGHSMGGKAAMVLALDQPELVNRLIVADIAPVAYDHSQSHLIAAMRALDLATVDTRTDADRALAGAIETDQLRAFLLQSLDVKDRRWRLNLDVLDREMGRITGFPEVTGRYDGPALFLAGAQSDYVTPEARPTIKALFSNARQAKIPGTGHWLHAEKPREFEAAARAFLGS